MDDEVRGIVPLVAVLLRRSVLWGVLLMLAESDEKVADDVCPSGVNQMLVARSRSLNQEQGEQFLRYAMRSAPRTREKRDFGVLKYICFSVACWKRIVFVNTL